MDHPFAFDQLQQKAQGRHQKLDVSPRKGQCRSRCADRQRALPSKMRHRIAKGGRAVRDLVEEIGFRPERAGNRRGVAERRDQLINHRRGIATESHRHAKSGVVETPSLPEPVRDQVVDVRLPTGPDAKDAPYCYQCGNAMQRAGSCFVCTSCGTTSGCS